MNPRLAAAALALSLLPLPGAATAGPVPAAAPPALAEVRAAMGIPSADDMRGQRDTVGFARPPRRWRASVVRGEPARPERFGSRPAPGVAGDRAARRLLYPAASPARRSAPDRTHGARRRLHKYRAFGARDQLVFDP